MDNVIGRTLRRLRGKRPIKEVSAAAGISQEYWHNIESGRRVPTDSRVYLKLLCLGLGLPKDTALDLLHDAYLEEMGLRDPDLRALCVAAIAGRLPPAARRAMVALRLGYQVLDRRGADLKDTPSDVAQPVDSRRNGAESVPQN